MNEVMRGKLLESFKQVPDFRVIGRVEHALIDILVISILAVISGREDWDEIADYGNAKEGWLRSFLGIYSGYIP